MALHLHLWVIFPSFLHLYWAANTDPMAGRAFTDRAAPQNRHFDMESRDIGMNTSVLGQREPKVRMCLFEHRPMATDGTSTLPVNG
ncbi:MAG: hypothetical protein AAFS01_10530, partial [Pseudomonadota bacterium]